MKFNKKKFIFSTTLLLLFFTFKTYGIEPIKTYTFDNNTDDAVFFSREGYYSDDCIYEITDHSLTYDIGMKGNSLYMNGEFGMKLFPSIDSDCCTFSYWIKPEAITQCTPTLMIVPYNFQDESFINVTLKADQLSPNIWTHTMIPEDIRTSIGPYDSIKENTWYFLTIVVDKKIKISQYTIGAALYINGFPAGTGEVPLDFLKTDSTYWFGINIWDDLYKGYVDELSFFNCALSESEVKELYLQSNGDPKLKSPVNTSVPSNPNNWGQNNENFHNNFFSDNSRNEIDISQIQGSIADFNISGSINSSPVSSTGTEFITNIFADMAFYLSFGVLGITYGLIKKYKNYHNNKY